MSHSNTASDWQLYRRLLSYAWPYKRFFLISFLGFLLYAAADVLLADLMQYMIDSLGQNIDTEQRNGLIVSFLHQQLQFDVSDTSKARFAIPVLIIIISLQRVIGSFLGNFFMKYVGNHVIFDLRTDIFHKMLDLPVYAIESQSSGSLVSRVIFNVTQVTGAVTNAITVIFRDGLTVILLLAYLIYLNWQLTLTFLAVAPLIALVVSFVSKRFRRLSKKLQRSMGDITHATSEAINGVRDLRIYGAHALEQQRFATVSRRTLSQQLKLAFTDAAFSPTIQFFLAIAIAALVVLGLHPDIIADMSAGLLVTFLGAAGALAKPIRQLTNVINIVQKALAAVQDIFQQLDQTNEQVLPLPPAQLSNPVRAEIEFDQVSFAYPGSETPVLKQLSMHIKPGQMIALVGGSGGGKSTLMSLLPRFYQPTSGHIRLDGIDINSLSLAELRQQIAIVSQQLVLINDTVHNNIAYGEMRNASREEVMAAAKLANADDFILSMADGYDTEIGDNGVRLSGGQRQRLAIARAILKQAPILILDEATSALDNDSERLIQEAMQTVAKGRTTFVIAHRLSTIENADCIYVLDNGELLEQGDHASLMAQGGRYYALQQNAQESVGDASASKPAVTRD